MQITRNQGADDASAAATDDDDLDIDAVFLNNPLSSATQTLPLVALTELNPTRTLSWADSGAAKSREIISIA